MADAMDLPGPDEPLAVGVPMVVPQAGRLVVVSQIYHQLPNQEPTVVDAGFVRALKSDEQPYSRQMRLTEEWVPLDHGWVESASCLRLANDEGTFPQVNPTPEERAVAEAKIVEVGLAISGLDRIEPIGFVHPRESSRTTPPDLSCLRLRCRSGRARCTVTVYPE